MSPKDYAIHAMQNHFKFDPVPADWQSTEDGRPGLAACIEYAVKLAMIQTDLDLMTEYETKVEEEREACAMIARDYNDVYNIGFCIAKDILARGNKK